jgi:uncharacterized membrane protein
MLERSLFSLTFVAALGSGLVAGVFFAFSSFVMAALARIAPASGIDAMNAINITVINPGFMLAFMGTGFICLLLAAGSYYWWGEVDAYLLLIAGLIYLVGSIGVTMMLNVPLNDMLAGVQSGTQQAQEFWRHYLSDWTFWNHVRTAASLLSAIMFTLILVRRAGLG